MERTKVETLVSTMFTIARFFGVMKKDWVMIANEQMIKKKYMVLVNIIF